MRQRLVANPLGDPVEPLEPAETSRLESPACDFLVALPNEIRAHRVPEADRMRVHQKLRLGHEFRERMILSVQRRKQAVQGIRRRRAALGMENPVPEFPQMRQQVAVGVHEGGERRVSEPGIPLDQPPIGLELLVKKTQVHVPQAVHEYAEHFSADTVQVLLYHLDRFVVLAAEQTGRPRIDDRP